MGLEIFGNIDDLNPLFPLGTDPKSEGDDHIRGVKESLQGNVSGDDAETRLLVAGAVVLLAKLGGIDITGSALSMFATDVPMLVRMLNTGAADVGVELSQAANGFVEIKETDGAGVGGNAWISMTRAGGVALNFDGAEKAITELLGLLVTGQVRVTEAAPVALDDLTRKDYVDGEVVILNAAIQAVQTDLDNVKNGFAFTGAISAPGVTEV